jgi:hypothetical protein
LSAESNIAGADVTTGQDMNDALRGRKEHRSRRAIPRGL